MHEYFNAPSALTSARSPLRSTNVTNDRDVQRILFFNFFEFFSPLSSPCLYPIPRKSFRHATINAALSNSRLVSFGEVEIHNKRREYISVFLRCKFPKVFSFHARLNAFVIKSRKKKNFPQNQRIYRQFCYSIRERTESHFRCN